MRTKDEFINRSLRFSIQIINALTSEADELTRILAASIITMKKSQMKKI